MKRDLFWLMDAQFAPIAPHLPNDMRGKPRVDDRRVIGGIIHALKSGGRWIDAPADHGPRKTLYNRYVRGGRQGGVERPLPGAFQALAGAGGPPAQVLTDRSGRPIAFLLTGGQVADRTAAASLLRQMPNARILHGDKGCDSNAVRRQVEQAGTLPNIPPKAKRRWKPCAFPALYGDRNAIERLFCRLKDFRRVATRHDRLAVTFPTATVCDWL